jgi:hypothetical protein
MNKANLTQPQSWASSAAPAPLSPPLALRDQYGSDLHWYRISTAVPKGKRSRFSSPSLGKKADVFPKILDVSCWITNWYLE